jgi:hypothetical protein
VLGKRHQKIVGHDANGKCYGDLHRQHAPTQFPVAVIDDLRPIHGRGTQTDKRQPQIGFSRRSFLRPLFDADDEKQVSGNRNHDSTQETATGHPG